MATNHASNMDSPNQDTVIKSLEDTECNYERPTMDADV